MIFKGVEKKEKNEINLKVEIEAAEFEAALQKAYTKNKGSLTVPGFRKGKAPRLVIEGMYGKNFFYEDAVNDLSLPAFDFAVAQEGLKTVGKPSCSDVDISDEKVVTLTFETALYPEATLGQYKGLEAPLEKPEIDEGFLANELERLQLRNSRLITVERAAAMGDIVTIDYLGTIDGVPFEGGKAEGFNLELGSGQFVPGFEDQVVGMKVDEERDLDVTFPEQYHEELAGKAAVFHVKVSEVKEREMPELDDEFAKDVSDFDTLDEYKKSILDAEQTRLDATAKQAFQDALLVKAIENMTVEIPDVMIDERQEEIVQDYARNLAMQGLQFDQYLGMMGMDYQAFYDTARPSAMRQVQTQILLAKVAEVEGITISDEAVEEEYNKMAEMYNVDLETVKKAVDEAGLRSDQIMKLAAEVVYADGIATEPVAKEEAETEEQKEETSAE